MVSLGIVYGFIWAALGLLAFLFVTLREVGFLDVDFVFDCVCVGLRFSLDDVYIVVIALLTI